ncbi:hypothetical protein A4S05_25880 [Nostoc sp. KVJ20]|nr:hypothetical protein A4S05_25880 [Nostoc sp. KVJ20]
MRYGVLLAYAPTTGLGKPEPGGTTGDWGSTRLWRSTIDSVQQQECNRGLALFNNAANSF